MHAANGYLDNLLGYAMVSVFQLLLNMVGSPTIYAKEYMEISHGFLTQIIFVKMHIKVYLTRIVSRCMGLIIMFIREDVYNCTRNQYRGQHLHQHQGHRHLHQLQHQHQGQRQHQHQCQHRLIHVLLLMNVTINFMGNVSTNME